MIGYNATRYGLQSLGEARWSRPDSNSKMRRAPIASYPEIEADPRRIQCRPFRVAARLVRPASPPVAVAAAGGRACRSVPGLAVGNHAAADRRQNGGAV